MSTSRLTFPTSALDTEVLKMLYEDFRERGSPLVNGIWPSHINVYIGKEVMVITDSYNKPVANVFAASGCFHPTRCYLQLRHKSLEEAEFLLAAKDLVLSLKSNLDRVAP
jgi:hypothetical protein